VTLLRFEQERFVRLDDAEQALGPVVLDPVKKAMAPAKGRVGVHADPPGRSTDGAGIGYRIQIIEPPAFVPQSRQRCAAQLIEGATACATAKALRVVSMTMPVATLAAAVRTAPALRPALADEGDHPVEPGCRMQRGEHLLALRLVQQRQPGEQLLELWRFHRVLPIDDDRDWTEDQLSSSMLVHI
jgi:hypothetical protein